MVHGFQMLNGPIYIYIYINDWLALNGLILVVHGFRIRRDIPIRMDPVERPISVVHGISNIEWPIQVNLGHTVDGGAWNRRN